VSPLTFHEPVSTAAGTNETQTYMRIACVGGQFAPSLSLSPRFSVLDARSDPARSTMLSLPMRTLPVTCAVFSACSTVTCGEGRGEFERGGKRTGECLRMEKS
jgi:hypothetical protein